MQVSGGLKILLLQPQCELLLCRRMSQRQHRLIQTTCLSWSTTKSAAKVFTAGILSAGHQNIKCCKSLGQPRCNLAREEMEII